MSKQLYEEALADVAQVRQVAEDNAKRAILEAVTPRIRELIERTLLEASDECGYEDESLDEEQASDEDLLKGSKHAKKSMDETIESVDEMFSGTVAEVSKIDENIMLKAQVAALGSGIKMLKEGKSVAPKKLYGKLVKKAETILEQSDSLDIKDLRQVAKLYKFLNEAKLTFTIEGDALNVAEDQMDSLKVFIEKPAAEEPSAEEAKPAGEGEAPEASAGESGGESGGGESVDISALLGGGGGAEADAQNPQVKQENRKMSLKDLSDDTVVEIDENMLKTEVARMRAIREGKAAKPVKAVDPKAKHFGGGSVVGEPFEDDVSDLERIEEAYDETYSADEDMDEQAALEAALEEILGDEGMHDEDEAVHHDEDEGMHDEDEAVHHDEDEGMHDEDEGMMMPHMDELQNRAKRDAAQGKPVPGLNEAKKVAAKAKAKAMKAKEEKALAKKKGKKLDEARADKAYVAAVNEYKAAVGKIRKLQESSLNSRAHNAEAEALRAKLAETNLFNAKLLYTNKLLQSDALTPRQKAVVIDRLDEAKSLREVKLVYESLAKALNDTAPRLQESADRKVLGSSSAPVRSAAPTLNEGYESARWAKLAGIG